MKLITWPVAALFIGVFGSVAVTLIFATPEVAEAVLAILATVGTSVAAYLRSPLHAPIGGADVTAPETPAAKRKTVPPLPLLTLAIVASLSGCAHGQKTAQTVASITARAIVEVDQDVSDRYAEAAAHALEASPTRAEYDAAMSRWNAVEAAMRSARGFLLSAQHAIDVWSEAGEHDWPGLAACLGAALVDVLAALDAVGVDSPRTLLQAASMGADFLGECRAEVTP